MKILKLVKDKFNHYSAVFDEIPKITYEKIGADYVGTAVNTNGDIIASHWLKREQYGGAFGGRELELKMTDGSVEKTKDYWFDHGSYPEHGEFMSIGAETLEGLQDCHVFFGFNIHVEAFRNMLDEYLAHDKTYNHDEVREWCRLQYEWHDVIVHGKKIPFMMNKIGEMVTRETKERVFPRHNKVKIIGNIYYQISFFRFKYEDNGRLIKIESNLLEVLKATLPHSEEEIRKNCKLLSIEEEEKQKRKLKLSRTIAKLTKTEKKTIFEQLKKEFNQLEGEVV